MMGLFRKDDPAEKKLKELTGGFLLSTSFMQILKDNNLEIEDGTNIKNQLKDEIKQGKLNEQDVQTRLNQLIKQYSKMNNPVSIKNCPKCNQTQELENTFCINCGYEFKNEVICPMCNLSQDSSNHYCIECGYDFVDNTVQNTKRECPNCHNIQDVDNNRCLDCGYDFNLKQMPKIVKKCPVCNLIQYENNVTCVNCKHDLKDVDYEPCDELIKCENCNRLIPKNKYVCPFCKFDFNAFESEKNENSKKEEFIQKDTSDECEFGITPENMDFTRKISFLNNYEFNMKTCPDCNTRFLKADPFCFNCGASVVSHDTVISDSVEFKNGKLVQKDETQNDELSDLEALYSQTVKSKYAPLFKIAYVLYLDSFDKNPSKQAMNKLARNYDTTYYKLKKQALEDEYIEPAPAISEARKTKVADLKEILKEYGLKVSGKKDELIERLDENLSEDELKKFFKSKNYQLSSKGEEFLSKNAPMLYVHNSRELSQVLLTYDLGKIFEEKIYTEDEIYDKLLIYLKRILDEKLNNEVLVDFKSTSNAIAKVQEDKGDLRDALQTRLKIFLFDINNYSSYADRADPGRTKLKKKDITPLVSLMHELTLPIDELKNFFEKAYNEVLFKPVITSQDSLIYLLKIFGGEDLDNISNEINENYSNPY